MVNYLGSCLFFDSQALARVTDEMAREIFMPTTLSPYHAYVLYAIILGSDISPTNLASVMSLSPSTITRLVDKLVQKGLVRREFFGKSSTLTATKNGNDLRVPIEKAMGELNQKFINMLGTNNLDSLNSKIKDFVVKFNLKDGS